MADSALDDVADPDIVLVPGGTGQTVLMTDGPVWEWGTETDRRDAAAQQPLHSRRPLGTV
jgi:hypothetical protein